MGTSSIEIEGATLMTSARAMLMEHEGSQLHVYKDSLGIPTIGVGFNLMQPGARDTITAIGADYDALLAGTVDLTPDQRDALLRGSIIDTIEWLATMFPGFSDFSCARQCALIDMGFMGEGHFASFKHMIADIRAGDWQGAAHEALGSKWAEQVGKRAYDVASLLVSE